MRRSLCCILKHDFDAWIYNIYWPQKRDFLPLLGFVSLTVEDIKFAYNAWCLLRLAMFFGTEHPKILSPLLNTTPSMNIIHRGNRLFYMHAQVEGRLSHHKTRVALTSCHPRARPLQSFCWSCKTHEAGGVCAKRESTAATEETESCSGFEIVLGMENGLSWGVAEECHHCLYIPQYGSIGSLSMLSALSIALHAAASADHGGPARRDVRASLPPLLRGHMPQNDCGVVQKEGPVLPHEKNFLSFSNDEIANVLRMRRMTYPMQLSVLVHNEFADRNFGAIMRNANVFNCEKMIVLCRRKFSRRGAVGTHHLLRTTYHASIKDKSCQVSLQGYVVWLLYQYYPYLKIYEDTNWDKTATFIRPQNAAFQEWLQCGHCMDMNHPMVRGGHGVHLVGTEVYLDVFDSVHSAVRGAMEDGYRGIMLVIPEEGATLPLDVVKCAQRIVHIAHPSRIARDVQRGLNGALMSAIALERLRTSIDCL